MFGIKCRRLQAQHPGTAPRQGYKSSRADRATMEGRGNVGGMGRKEEADLGHGNKPRAAHESYTEILVAADIDP